MNGLRILGIDTSGKMAAAAVYDTEQVCFLAQEVVYTKRTHSQVILPLAERLLSDAGLTIHDIEGFAAIPPIGFIFAFCAISISDNIICTPFLTDRGRNCPFENILFYYNIFSIILQDPFFQFGISPNFNCLFSIFLVLKYTSLAYNKNTRLPDNKRLSISR